MSVKILKESNGAGMLVSLARVKSELGITDSSKDAELKQRIKEASAVFERLARRRFSRCLAREKLAGGDTTEELLTVAPVRVIVQVLHEDVAVTDVVISDEDAGIILRTGGFPAQYRTAVYIAKHTVLQPKKMPWQIDYLAGYLTETDNYIGEAGGVVFDASDGSINAAAENFPLLAAGDSITVSGTAQNNEVFTVVSATAGKIVTEEGVFTETPAGAVSIVCADLPLDIGVEVLNVLVNAWNSKGKDRTITSEKIGDWSATYERSLVESSVVRSYRRYM